MDPKFRKNANGLPCLYDSEEALKVKAEKRPWVLPQPPDKVRESARLSVLRLGGDVDNELDLLGQHELQFGIYRGQTFKWVAENALGYGGYLTATVSLESGKSDSHNNLVNKVAFQKYLCHYPEGQYAYEVKKEKILKAREAASTSLQPATSSNPSTSGQLSQPSTPAQRTSQPSTPAQHTSEPSTPAQPTSGPSTSARLTSQSSTSRQQPSVPISSLRSLLIGKGRSQQTLDKSVKRLFSPQKFQPSVPTVSSARPTPAPSNQPEPTDSELLEAAQQMEPDLAESRICLPAGWIPALPEVDQRWISKALFRLSHTNQPELDQAKVDKMWWYPPQPSLTSSAMPALEQYFGHPLVLWMPRKLWRVKLLCPHADCGKSELTSAGLHQRVRHVVAVSTSYYLASEYLACKSCKRKVIGWSHSIVSQLDIGHRIEFPCLLTQKLGCDMEVVRLMRQRGLGNSSSQLQKQLEEQHAETWLGKQIRFLTASRGIARAVSSGLISPVTLEDLPAMPAVPKHRWLMQVYAQDVLSRVDEVKASITSLFGQVLKLDSTKKIVRKLAGQARATASWATNIGNEHGQVIMSVLTASEGWGLMKMAEGLVRRYREAGVPPPEILYVDRDCCGKSHLQKIFAAWPGMKIRLDVWHFMRRIATGCSTDSHPLYTSFMAQLTRCIFVWDEGDLQQLRAAKRAELERLNMRPTEEDVTRHITKAEMMLHCRRAVRDSAEMGVMLSELIRAYDGEKGCDTLGVPLINSARMAEIWKAQQKHLPCLQDPPGFQLYTQTGTLKKAGHDLPTYRCARGSTSLENFHLHMNRFIPGTLASDVFFQAYLVDGLARWNEDRTVAVEGKEGPHSYSGLLRYAANKLSMEVLGRQLVDYTPPRKYTGELIGVEYLYSQNNAVMEDYKLALVAMETEDIVVAEEETRSGPSEADDLTVPNMMTIWPPQLCQQPSGPTPPSRPPTSAAPVSHSTPPAHVTSPALPAALHPQPSTSFSLCSAPVTVHHPTPEGSWRPAGSGHSLDPQLQPSTQGQTSRDVPLSHQGSQQPPRSSEEEPSTSSGSTHHDDSVGPDNVEGFQAVQDLADCLFGLKDHSLALSREEAAGIIALWDCLSEYDKGRTIYPERHQQTIPKGRFRATKKIVSPGVESTKRCFAGGRSPAQWPDCNRVCEALFMKLCAEYSGPRRIDGVRHERWSLVTRAYLHVRQVILNNATVMERTTIQLPVMNTATIASWYCKKRRQQEKVVLQQGIPAPKPTFTSPESLPPAVKRKGTTCMPYPSEDNPHIFVLPPNTAGMAQLKKRQCLPLAPSAGLGVPFLAALEPPVQATMPTVPHLPPAPRPLLPASQLLQPSPRPLQPASQPLQPSPPPLQPAPRPLLPASQLLQPSPRPLQPASQPLQPSPQPLQPAFQLLQPSPRPLLPASQPLQPSPQPLQTAFQLLQLAPRPLLPASQPLQPSPQPLQPASQPLQPSPQALQPPPQLLQSDPRPLLPASQPLPPCKPLQPPPQLLQLAARPLLPASQLLQPPPQLLQPAPQPLQPAPLLQGSLPLASAVCDVPYTTQYYHKRKKQEEEQSGKTKRKYTRKTDNIKCKQCQRERDPPPTSNTLGIGTAKPQPL